MNAGTGPADPPPAAGREDRGPGMVMPDELGAVTRYHELVTRGERLPAEDAEEVTGRLQQRLQDADVRSLLQLPVPDMSDYLAAHALNVALLAMALARDLGLGATEVRDIGVAGLLHDLGMVLVPLELLSKPDPLEPAERELIKQHPALGATAVVHAARPLPLAAVAAYEHHLRVDRGGYPRRPQPRQAHWASRLVQLCDVYDALRTPRPFRQAWPDEIIRSFVSARAGVEFDPELSRSFLDWLRRLAATG